MHDSLIDDHAEQCNLHKLENHTNELHLHGKELNHHTYDLEVLSGKLSELDELFIGHDQNLKELEENNKELNQSVKILAKENKKLHDKLKTLMEKMDDPNRYMNKKLADFESVCAPEVHSGEPSKKKKREMPSKQSSDQL